MMTNYDIWSKFFKCLFYITSKGFFPLMVFYASKVLVLGTFIWHYITHAHHWKRQTAGFKDYWVYYDFSVFNKGSNVVLCRSPKYNSLFITVIVSFLQKGLQVDTTSSKIRFLGVNVQNSFHDNHQINR